MDANQIRERLQKILVDVVEFHSERQLDTAEITDNADVFDDLGLDSLVAVALLVEIQRTFRVKLPDNDVASLRTLSRMTNYLADRIK